jgi:hypothetical protein
MKHWEKLRDGARQRWVAQTRDRARLWSLGVLAATLVVSSLFVVATHTRLSQTADEPNHLATGLQWWQSGTYRLHPENPPLSRIAIAASPFQKGWRLRGGGNAWDRGTRLLYGGRGPRAYRNRLHRMRMGVLPFFWLTVILVWLWAFSVGGPRAGIAACAVLATAGPLLGHAGLATTDVPFVGTFLLALFGYVCWLNRPTIPRALLFAAGLTLATVTKFSTLVFFPAAALVILPLWLWARRSTRSDETADDESTSHTRKEPPAWLWWWRGWRARIGGVLLVAVVLFMGVWGAYRFSTGRATDLPGVRTKIDQCVGSQSSWKRSLTTGVAETRLPAPEFLQGVLWVCAHNKTGHRAYLLGQTSQTGFASFYFVSVAVRTPLPLLALFVVGAIWAFVLMVRLRDPVERRHLWPVAAATLSGLVVLGVASAGNINLGLRHVLLVMPLMSVVAGWTVARLWEQSTLRSLRRGLLVVLVAWQLVGFVRTHPHHVAYFNSLAGDEPGRILVDSDLDWGQDLLALEDLLGHSPIRHLHVAYFGTAMVCRHSLPKMTWLVPGRRVTGWVAISEMYYRGMRSRMFRNPCNPRSAYAVGQRGRQGYAWLDRYTPVLRAGRSIRIYYIPE